MSAIKEDITLGPVRLILGDCRETLKTLPDESVQCCVTSPPYWGLRDYGCDGQIGLESEMEDYVGQLVAVFREVRRALRKDGTLWLNLGDSYNGYMANQRATSISANNQHARPVFESGHGRRTDTLKPKDLVGIPWRVAFALQSDGWWLRQDIIWSKPNPMPESVRDRCTKAHEYLFLLTKSDRYYWDQEAIREPHMEVSLARAKRNRFGGKYVGSDPTEHGALKSGNGYGPNGNTHTVCSPGGRNKRSVWTIPTAPYAEAHFATFPPDLVKPCILAGTKPGDTVLDPFSGSGTVGQVATELGRKSILCELNPEYVKLAGCRTDVTMGLPFASPTATQTPLL